MAIILILAASALGFFVGNQMKAQKLEAQAMNEQFIGLLDDVAYSYGPLKLIKAEEQGKAEELLHARLGDSLSNLTSFVEQHPHYPANKNMKMIQNAQALYDGRATTSE